MTRTLLGLNKDDYDLSRETDRTLCPYIPLHNPAQLSLSLEMLFVYADGFHPCRGDAEVPSALLKSPAAE